MSQSKRPEILDLPSLVPGFQHKVFLLISYYDLSWKKINGFDREDLELLNQLPHTTDTDVTLATFRP